LPLSVTPSVLIVIINWNSLQDTLACLESLKQLSYSNFKTLVVDNGSSENPANEIRTKYPEVLLFEAGSNLGFTGGNNLGLTYALEQGIEYTLLLNADTTIEPDFLQHLVEALNTDDKAGIAGPSIYYYDHPQTLWSAGGEIDWQCGDTQMIGIDEADAGQFGVAPRAVDFISGCALLVKMSMVQTVGNLDERFFAYYEETEWCVRSARYGYRILHVPQAKIWHKISPEKREASPVVHYYMTRNRLLFLKATRAGPKPWSHTLFDFTKRLVSWTIKPRWRHKRPQRQAMLRALMDFASGRFGKTTYY